MYFAMTAFIAFDMESWQDGLPLTLLGNINKTLKHLEASCLALQLFLFCVSTQMLARNGSINNVSGKSYQ